MPVTPDDGRSSEADVEGGRRELAWKHQHRRQRHEYVLCAGAGARAACVCVCVCVYACTHESARVVPPPTRRPLRASRLFSLKPLWPRGETPTLSPVPALDRAHDPPTFFSLLLLCIGRTSNALVPSLGGASRAVIGSVTPALLRPTLVLCAAFEREACWDGRCRCAHPIPVRPLTPSKRCRALFGPFI